MGGSCCHLFYEIILVCYIQNRTDVCLNNYLKRHTGIGPAYSAWEAGALPLC